MRKKTNDLLPEIWIVDAPITLLYCICRSYLHPVKAVVVNRLEFSLDEKIISMMLRNHDIEILDYVSIFHPRYTNSITIRKKQSSQVVALLDRYYFSTLFVRAGSGFLYFIPPWRKVTLIQHGFGDFLNSLMSKNPVKDIIAFTFYSVHYIFLGWHQLRSSYFHRFVPIHHSLVSSPFIDLSNLKRSEYFKDLLNPLKKEIDKFRLKTNSKVILCLPALKSSDLRNVYIESTVEAWLEAQCKLFSSYANDCTLLVFKHHPAASTEDIESFLLMLDKLEISFIDVNNFPNCNNALLPVELLMHTLEFDLLVSPGTAAIINKPKGLNARIIPSSIPDTKFQKAFSELTSAYQVVSGDSSAMLL